MDELWVDYITRQPVDAKYLAMKMSHTEAVNATLADAKRFSMSFDNGTGLAVCSPFQVNREGFKKAKANSGQMDKTALAQYNAAEKEADVISYIFYDSDESITHEPKIGMMKSRWGAIEYAPSPVFIDPDCRRIYDMTGGMPAGAAPTQSANRPEDEVAL